MKIDYNKQIAKHQKAIETLKKQRAAETPKVSDENQPPNRTIILNSIKTPDGTILVSRHRHDFVEYTDNNGHLYYVDGGNDYLRRGYGDVYEECSLYSDDDFETIRKHYARGGRGKDGKQPLKWVPLCDMNDEWLANCIVYNEERGMGSSIANELYVKEQEYRKINNIKIEENEI